jgi:OFA family oxalate/formate antiporter-like MFS transporter
VEGGQKSSALSNPWVQLVFGIICMATIANLQYAWPLFRAPIAAKFGWNAPAVEVSFTIFLVVQTWLVPVEGWLIDKYGSRPLIVAGGLLCGISWLLYGTTDSLVMLYLAAALGGLGAGCVYGACIANAIKWFPLRRGLAVGLTAAGYGAGAAITVGPVGDMIKAQGFEHAFTFFGIAQSVIVIVMGMLIARVSEEVQAQKPTLAGATQYNAKPMEILREPTFWIMYLMFTLMVAAGTIVTGQLSPLGKEYGIAKTTAIPVLTWLTLTMAQDMGRVINGLTRPFFGWISDSFGREQTMFVAFMLLAVSIASMALIGRDPLAFVVLFVLIFLFWGEIYALFPSACGDSFGARHAATNAGMLYTAKGTANLLVPFGPVVISATGNFEVLLFTTAAMAAAAAILAITVLKPMRLELANRYNSLWDAGKGR